MGLLITRLVCGRGGRQLGGRQLGRHRAIAAAASDADLVITAARADGADWGARIVVTVNNGRENTWAGGAWSREEILDCYGACCDPSAVEALCRAWQVTLVDPRWARNDHLWPVLQALRS